MAAAVDHNVRQIRRVIPIASAVRHVQLHKRRFHRKQEQDHQRHLPLRHSRRIHQYQLLADPWLCLYQRPKRPACTDGGDINPNTGDPALRFLTPVSWEPIRQIATGLVGGKTTSSPAGIKGSAPGIKSDIAYRTGRCVRQRGLPAQTSSIAAQATGNS